MALLPDTYVPCESGRGKRYNADTQAVLFKDRSVAQVLEMTIDEAREHFAAVGAVRRPLDFLSEIGLGYLQLGQPSPRARTVRTPGLPPAGRGRPAACLLSSRARLPPVARGIHVQSPWRRPVARPLL